MPSKLCPTHGPIDWPLTATTCPACGAELEAFDSAVEMALSMADLRDNSRALIQQAAEADLDLLRRRFRERRDAQRPARTPAQDDADALPDPR